MPPSLVLHFITRWIKGGAEEKMLGEMQGLGERYSFALAHGATVDPSMAARVEALGVPRSGVPALRHYNPLSGPVAVRGFRRVLRAVDPDLLHLHSTEAGAVGRVAARGSALPVVYTLHGMPFGPGRGLPLRAFVRAVERRLAPHTTRFVANADAIRDAYLAAGIGRPEQYVTIRSGVDLGAVEAARPAALPGAPPRVLFAGRLAEGKGLPDAVAAVEAVRASGVRAHLLVAGEGPLRGWLDAQARTRPWVHALGFREDLPSVLKACDVLALPSRLEGTPRVVTEAMACGLPVVATRVGGLPEQLGDGEAGLLVPLGDAGALADALEAVLRDEGLRARLGAAGRARAKMFSVEAMLAATDALYRGLLR